MDILALRDAVPALAKKGHPDKFRIFAWWLQAHNGQASFTGADIAYCYRALDLAEPTGYTSYLKSLANQGDILKAGAGYKLEHATRQKLHALYGEAETVVKIKATLADLAAKLPTVTEQDYYKESLICYHHGAFRAAVIMTWNLAFAHLCDHILANRLTDFNAQWLLTYPGMHRPHKSKSVAVFDDFGEKLKESETLAISRDGGIITKAVHSVMHAALGKRNAAAHPSTHVINQTITDGHIEDLIVNAVLKIA